MNSIPLPGYIYVLELKPYCLTFMLYFSFNFFVIVCNLENTRYPQSHLLKLTDSSWAWMPCWIRSTLLIISPVWLDEQKRKFSMRHYMFEVAAIITNITPQPYPARSTNLLNYFGQFLSSIPIPCDSRILLLGYAANRNSSLKSICRGM